MTKPKKNDRNEIPTNKPKKPQIIGACVIVTLILFCMTIANTRPKEEILKTEIYFSPNQQYFSVDTFAEEFSKIVDVASKHSNVKISIEGHSDPLHILNMMKKNFQSEILLKAII